MPAYQPFTADDAVAFARRHGGLEDPSVLVGAREVGDGNLNLVFKVLDAAGESRVVVKQALPYVRCVGESWPLTIDRARLEAQTLLEHARHCPEHTVRVLHFEPPLAAMTMEDLSSHRIWRGELVKGVHYDGAARRVGEYLARTLFHTSDFFLHPHEKKAQVSRFTNPEMCGITEDLFFDDPYRVHARNNYPPELEATVASLREDAELKAAVAALKHRFFSHAEALLHGDLHSGSLFVAEGRLKAIDAEFGAFGPMGFDVGTVIGNLLLNACGAPGQPAVRDAAAAQERRLADIAELWEAFGGRFAALAREATRDAALAAPGYAARFLRKAWEDAVGFAGTELVRRSVGLAHVADLDGIPDVAVRRACLARAIALGRTLIVSAPQLGDVAALSARVRALLA